MSNIDSNHWRMLVKEIRGIKDGIERLIESQDCCKPKDVDGRGNLEVDGNTIKVRNRFSKINEKIRKRDDGNKPFFSTKKEDKDD